jgi:hypothetical protein
MTTDPCTYRTKTGRILTDADIQALADEAERGYPTEKLARRRGRPRMGSAPAVVVPVRLHADFHAAMRAQATVESTSLSELVRDALRAYLADEPPVVRTCGLRRVAFWPRQISTPSPPRLRLATTSARSENGRVAEDAALGPKSCLCACHRS